MRIERRARADALGGRGLDQAGRIAFGAGEQCQGDQGVRRQKIECRGAVGTVAHRGSERCVPGIGQPARQVGGRRGVEELLGARSQRRRRAGGARGKPGVRDRLLITRRPIRE